MVVIDSNDQRIKCLGCGDSAPLNLPAEVTKLAKDCTAWAKPHRQCRRITEKGRMPRGIGYWWELVFEWSDEKFELWLEAQSRETLVAMLQETDPNGSWDDTEAMIEIGTITSLKTARHQMRTFFKESKETA